MTKVNTVIKFEIIRQLKKPSFWISLLLLPLIIIAIFVLSFLSGANAGDIVADDSSLSGHKIGITNDSGLYDSLIDSLRAITEDIDSTESEPTTVSVISTKKEGVDKIKSGDLTLYYYLPDDLLTSHSAEIYYSAQDSTIFTDYSSVLSSLLASEVYANLSIEDQLVVLDNIEYKSFALDSEGEAKNFLGEAIVPLCILIIFYVLICVFGNRLLAALTEEKENRISELLLTSVSAKDLVIGKIISLIVLGFLQIAVFIIPILVIIFLYRDDPTISDALSIISVNPWLLISNILLLIFSYFLYVGFSTFISSFSPTMREASNYFSFILIAMILPMFFIENLMSSTPTLLSYVLTYFPFTSPLALMLRNAFGLLPIWELILGLAELAIFSAITLYFTVVIFQKNAINFSSVKIKLPPKFASQKH